MLVVSATDLFLRSGFRHQSCKITWTTKEDCKTAQDALVTSAQSMDMDADCGSGEKCNYNVVEDDDNFLKTTHVTPTTPVSHVPLLVSLVDSTAVDVVVCCN